jgi:uncharacterized membrane protein
MGWMWVFWFLLFTALMLIVFSAARNARNARRERDAEDDALRQHFSHGEISQEDYESWLRETPR